MKSALRPPFRYAKQRGRIYKDSVGKLILEEPIAEYDIRDLQNWLKQEHIELPSNAEYSQLIHIIQDITTLDGNERLLSPKTSLY